MEWCQNRFNEAGETALDRKSITKDICQRIGKRRSAVQTSIRTIRKCGIEDFNLTEFEKIRVLEGMEREKALYGGLYR